MEKNGCYVYKHTCIITGKSYIGWCSRNPKYRWGKNGSNYLVKSGDRLFDHKKFAPAILKYGWNNFTHDILFYNLTEKEALEKEKEMIIKYDSFKNGYNSTLGGDGSTGRNHTEESKNKVSATKLKSSKIIYCYNKFGELVCAMKGYKQIAKYLNLPSGGIADCCIKVKDQHNSHRTAYGYVFANIKLTKNEIKKRYESYKKKFDCIYMYDIISEKLINKFYSYEEAIKNSNICRSSISGCCNGRTRFVKNYIFSFKELSKNELLLRKKYFNIKHKRELNNY